MDLSFLRKELEKEWNELNFLCSLIPNTEEALYCPGFPWKLLWETLQ